jgi:hypothetical protein
VLRRFRRPPTSERSAGALGNGGASGHSLRRVGKWRRGMAEKGRGDESGNVEATATATVRRWRQLRCGNMIGIVGAIGRPICPQNSLNRSAVWVHSIVVHST